MSRGTVPGVATYLELKSQKQVGEGRKYLKENGQIFSKSNENSEFPDPRNSTNPKKGKHEENCAKTHYNHILGKQ